MLGTTLGHYRILRELGRGGMGIVYLAADARLEREVALKVLPASADPDPEASLRFQREAKLASAVTHPNIVSVYEVGEAPEGRYIAMEYIEGETLAEKLKGKRLSVEQSIRIGRQIAEALDAAQARGIVHRDLKPGNVMLTPTEHVKVVDFGLARRGPLPSSGQKTLATQTLITQEHRVLGTLSYMSPEQLAGRPLDGRSDIFSLGSVLYEMLAGRRPFDGGSPPELIGRILHVEPAPIARPEGEVPAELDLIVRKCLEKDPAKRYQTARELRIDLSNLERAVAGRNFVSQQTTRQPLQARRTLLWAAVGLLLLVAAAGALLWLRTPRSIDSVAVLPFLNATGDRNLDYVSEGLGEAISDDLSRIPRLRVTAHSVVERYRTNRPDPQALGRELRVRTLLSGRVEQRGDTLNVRVELLNVADGAQLWARDYQRPTKDLAELQETLSLDVAYGLRQAIGASMKQNLARRYATSSEAYQLYLKGRFSFNRRTLQDNQEAVRLFQQATAKDPSFALAYAGLADAYIEIAERGDQPPVTVLELAKAAAGRALELDSGLSESWLSLAAAHTLTGFDWESAEREYRRAIELNPENAQAHIWYALWLLCPRQRPEEALLEIERALDLEPANAVTDMTRGMILYFARRYDQAAAEFQSVEKLAPAMPFAPLQMAMVDVETGRKQEAVAIAEQPSLRASLPSESRFILAVVYAAAGRRNDAQRIASELEEQSRNSYVSAYGRALIQAALGNSADALKLLEEAYAVREPDFVFLKVDPQLDSLRQLSGFQKLLKMGNF
jgi:TolB-like protein/Flp pilus assembly protein TadD/predicted Ser/Thr protein kinase